MTALHTNQTSPTAMAQPHTFLCPDVLVFSAGEQVELRAYLLGAKPMVAEQAAENLLAAYPWVSVVGTHHGYFAWNSCQAITEEINGLNANLVLVGLGAPLQERWIVENAHRVGAVMITCGGYLDQLAQRVTYYPQWITDLRMNWLYRLIDEPTRLWRRYTVEMLAFGLAAVTDRFRDRRSDS